MNNYSIIVEYEDIRKRIIFSGSIPVSLIPCFQMEMQNLMYTVNYTKLWCIMFSNDHPQKLCHVCKSNCNNKNIAVVLCTHKLKGESGTMSHNKI